MILLKYVSILCFAIVVDVICLALLHVLCHTAARNECLQLNPKDRPSMLSVKKALETKTRVIHVNDTALKCPSTPPSPSQTMLRLFAGMFSSAVDLGPNCEGAKSEGRTKGPKPKAKC